MEQLKARFYKLIFDFNKSQTPSTSEPERLYLYLKMIGQVGSLVALGLMTASAFLVEPKDK